MAHQRILNSLNESNESKFLTGKWNIFNDQSYANYDVGNEIIYNGEVLESDLCDYNDAYILVKGDIVTTAHNIPTQVAFQNCAPFIKYITKTDGPTTDDAEELDLVMPMYNLTGYSSNYSETAGSSWFYSKDEATNLMQILLAIIILNLLKLRQNC